MRRLLVVLASSTAAVVVAGSGRSPSRAAPMDDRLTTERPV
jgi:hypothetical protein